MSDSRPRDDRNHDSRRDYTHPRGGGGGRDGRDSRDNRDGRDGRDNRDSRDQYASRGGAGGSGGRRDNHRPNRSRSPRGDRRGPDRQRNDYPRPRRGSDDRGASSNPRGGGNNNPSDRARPSIEDRRAAPSSKPSQPSAKTPQKPPTLAMNLDGDDASDDEAAMKRIMGFAGFKTTKNTKVPGNDRLFGVRKDKQTQYRQYMNRVGGFNRPLSPSQM